MKHNIIHTGYLYWGDAVTKVEVYDNPLTLGEHVFWYCIVVNNGALSLATKENIYNSSEEAIEEWNRRQEEFEKALVNIPKMKDVNDE